MGRILVYAAVFLILFELTCRVEDLIRYGTPILSPYTSQMDLIHRDELGARGRPYARFQQFVLNDLGMRGPSVERSKTPTTLRVVTAGASETFGLYESSNREYPRQLEDTLLAALPDISCRAKTPYDRVEVANPSLPGISLPTVTLDLKNRVAELAPDFVVYYPTPQQYLADDPPGYAPPAEPGRIIPDRKRALRPRSVARVRSQVKNMLPAAVQTELRHIELEKTARSRPPGWRFTAIPLDRLGQFDRDLRELVGTIRAIGALPILATNTNAFLGDDPASRHVLYAWERFTPRATGGVILAFDSVARHVVRNIARDSVIPLADVEPVVQGQWAFTDYSHFSDEGAAAVAGILARTILGEIERTVCGVGGRARTMRSADHALLR